MRDLIGTQSTIARAQFLTNKPREVTITNAAVLANKFTHPRQSQSNQRYNDRSATTANSDVLPFPAIATATTDLQFLKAA